MIDSANPKPLWLWLSVAATALFLPLWSLLDRFSGPCADGMCSYASGVLLAAGCALATLMFAVVGLVRKERPRWILLLILPISAGLIVVLAL